MWVYWSGGCPFFTHLRPQATRTPRQQAQRAPDWTSCIGWKPSSLLCLERPQKKRVFFQCFSKMYTNNYATQINTNHQSPKNAKKNFGPPSLKIPKSGIIRSSPSKLPYINCICIKFDPPKMVNWMTPKKSARFAHTKNPWRTVLRSRSRNTLANLVTDRGVGRNGKQRMNDVCLGGSCLEYILPIRNQCYCGVLYWISFLARYQLQATHCYLRPGFPVLWQFRKREREVLLQMWLSWPTVTLVDAEVLALWHLMLSKTLTAGWEKTRKTCWFLKQKREVTKK